MYAYTHVHNIKTQRQFKNHKSRSKGETIVQSVTWVNKEDRHASPPGDEVKQT